MSAGNKNSRDRKPLEGVKVVDLTIAMAGPLATQRLGDLGADVIKIEAPGNGDLTRVFLLNNLRLGEDTTSFISLNRNKRSIVLNLKSKEGLDLIHRLASEADVFVQNFRPGVAERLGIDYATLEGLNPRLIYASVTGYGREGPLVGAPGQDLLAQAFSGLMFSGGRKSDGPHPSPCYMADTCASHLLTTGIVAALYDREQTGHGGEVETSLLGALMEMQTQEVMTYLASGKAAQQCEALYASVWLDPPYGTYRTRDGWLAFAQNDLTVISEAIDLPELGKCVAQRPDDPLSEGGLKWREQCYEILAARLQEMETAEAHRTLSDAKVWCMPVNSFEEAMSHPQSALYFSSFGREDYGTVPCVAPAVKVGRNSGPGQVLGPAPRLGEHSREVLGEMGLTDEQIQRLFDAGVVS